MELLKTLDKKNIIIFVLLSLLFSLLLGLFYMINKNAKIVKNNNELVVCFVAKENILKNKLIEKQDLKQIKIEKKYLLNDPLVFQEIIGKYANENILKNDYFRKEKLSTKIIEENILDKNNEFVYSSYNMPFKNFANPNFSLLKNDKINIISVYPEENTKQNLNFIVKIVAKNINILGFLEQGKKVDTTYRIEKQKIKLKNGKTTDDTENIKIFADEILLDIKSMDILNILNDFNKGNQLWMVKVNEKEEKEIIDLNSEIKDYLKTIKISNKEIKKTTRSLKLNYEPKDIYIEHNIGITYSNDINNTKIEKKYKEKINNINNCYEIKDYLKTIKDNVNVFKTPNDFSEKHNKIQNKNTLVPFKKDYENKKWFKTCDDAYIKQSDVIYNID